MSSLKAPKWGLALLAASALLAVAAVGSASTCAPGSPCGTGCCAPGTTCDVLNDQICCDSLHPVQCSQTCCPLGNTCNTQSSNPQICCDSLHPIQCAHTCCPPNGHCSPDGYTCGASCPTGAPECSGLCCPVGTTCNTLKPGFCCPSGFPVSCPQSCCGAGNACNPLNSNICCPPGFPLPCLNTCCASGYQCSSDGSGCVASNPCTDPSYPGDCGNGHCCPAGDRCQPVLIGDVIYSYCCIDLPQQGCCQAHSVGPLAETLDSTTVVSKAGGSKCRKSKKVRPFDVLQISAASAGGGFDTANHEYSVAFSLGRTKGHDVVLKVPLIQEDSNASTLSAMIPPFLLQKSSHGSASVFIVTDGVTSEDCVGRVRIAKLPKSASKIIGLVTLSWLRANQTIYANARPALATAEAAPFINPSVLTDVDTAIAKAASLIPSFDLGKNAKKNPLAKTAQQSDILLTGILTAGKKVGDATFSSACTIWLQALARAQNADDPSLKAAELAYANALLNASGATAQSVAKFTVACGAVTSAGIGASSTLIAGGAVLSAPADTQAAANVICGATVGASAVVCGMKAVAAGASASAAAGTTAYGKTLLTGSAQVGASTRTNYPAPDPATSPPCGCHQPTLQGVITISITIISTCTHIRTEAPKFCLTDGLSPMAPSAPTTTTTTMPQVANCNDQQVAGGDTADTRNVDLGKTSGTATFDYDTYSQKDRIIVSYQGVVLLDTGCVGEAASKPLTYSGSSTQMTVEVQPNCAGGSGTAWNYTLHCPP